MARVSIGPNARFSYAYVFSPNPKDGKYQVDVLIHKQDPALQTLFQAYGEVMATVAGNSKFVNIHAQHPSFKQCLKDGDQYKPNDHVYAGHWFFTAKTKDRPQVVGPAVEPLSSETQFYSGCYGNVTVEFRLYSPSQYAPESGYGIRAVLGNIQKVRDGERLSGGAAATQEFQQVGPPTIAAPVVQQPSQAPGAYPGAAGQPGFQPAPTPAPYNPNPQPGFGAPAAPQYTPVPAQHGFPNQPSTPQYAPSVQPQPSGIPAVPSFTAPFPVPQQNPFAPAQQAPTPAQPYGAPAVNPAAPQAPWPGAAAPQAQALPWEANRFPQ